MGLSPIQIIVRPRPKYCCISSGGVNLSCVLTYSWFIKRSCQYYLFVSRWATFWWIGYPIKCNSIHNFRKILFSNNSFEFACVVGGFLWSLRVWLLTNFDAFQVLKRSVQNCLRWSEQQHFLVLVNISSIHLWDITYLQYKSSFWMIF